MSGAVFNRHKDIVALLIADKADVNGKANDGATPLHIAAARGQMDIAELLIANKANVNAKSTNGGTPLHSAAAEGSTDIIGLLLDNNADIGAKDIKGDTPLHIAAGNGHNKEAVQFLLDHKADVNAKDLNGYTPLDLAAFRGDKDSVEVLLANKADVDAKDKAGYTALHWAAQGERRDLVELLLPDLITRLHNPDPAIKQSAADELAKSGVVMVSPNILTFLDSLQPQTVFFTSARHPIHSLDDIKDPDIEFGVTEFSPRMIRLRQLLSTKSVPSDTGASQSPAFNVQPLGQTSMNAQGVTLMGIGEDAYGTLFQKNPSLELFAAPRGTSGPSPIEATGGGMRVCFVAPR